MPLNKLENFIKNTEGRILYVNPNDLDSTDAIDFITAMGHAHSTSTVSDNTITASKLNDALAITNTPVRKNTNRIQTGFTLDSSDNAVVGGPITIDSGVSVVINGSLSIV